MCLRRMWMRPVRPHLRRLLPHPLPQRRLAAAPRRPSAAVARSLLVAPRRLRAVVARSLLVALRRPEAAAAAARSLLALMPARRRHLARRLRREVLRPPGRPRGNLLRMREARRRPLAPALPRRRRAAVLLPVDLLDAAAVGPSRRHRQAALAVRAPEECGRAPQRAPRVGTRAMALAMAMRMRRASRPRRPFGAERMKLGLISLNSPGPAQTGGFCARTSKRLFRAAPARSWCGRGLLSCVLPASRRPRRSRSSAFAASSLNA